MKKNILKLIKKTGSVRKFKKKSIKKELVKLIVEAGVWGPSLFGIQPWHFIVITKKAVIKQVSLTICTDSKKHHGILGKLLQISSRIIGDSRALIVVYNNNKIKKSAAKYGVTCMRKGWMAELLSTGATVQNMFLILNSMGLGGVWLDAPAIFPAKINKILNQKNELTVILAIGYPDQEIIRSVRNYKKIVKFI